MFKRFIAVALSFLVITICFNVSSVIAATYNFTYDGNGNLLQGKDNYYEYDSLNNLIRARDGNSTGTILEEYTYDHNGDRIKKIEYLSVGGTNHQ